MIPKSTAYKVVCAKTNVILFEGSSKTMERLARKMNKESPKSVYLANSPGRKVGEIFPTSR